MSSYKKEGKTEALIKKDSRRSWLLFFIYCGGESNSLLDHKLLGERSLNKGAYRPIFGTSFQMKLANWNMLVRSWTMKGCAGGLLCKTVYLCAPELLITCGAVGNKVCLCSRSCKFTSQRVGSLRTSSTLPLCSISVLIWRQSTNDLANCVFTPPQFIYAKHFHSPCLLFCFSITCSSVLQMTSFRSITQTLCEISNWGRVDKHVL